MKRPRSRSFPTNARAACALCAWLVCAGLAFGKGVFQQHYDSGVERYQQGKYEEALTEFKAAYAIKQVQLVLINLAQTDLKLGQPGDALRHCEMYLQAEPNPPPEIRARIEGYRDRARQQLAQEQARASTAAAPPAAAASAPPAPEPAPRAAPRPLPAAAVAADPVRARPAAVPVYRRWWLWTAVGVVAAGTAAGIAGGLLASRAGPPPSDLGTISTFR